MDAQKIREIYKEKQRALTKEEISFLRKKYDKQVQKGNTIMDRDRLLTALKQTIALFLFLVLVIAFVGFIIYLDVLTGWLGSALFVLILLVCTFIFFYKEA